MPPACKGQTAAYAENPPYLYNNYRIPSPRCQAYTEKNRRLGYEKINKKTTKQIILKIETFRVVKHAFIVSVPAPPMRRGARDWRGREVRRARGAERARGGNSAPRHRDTVQENARRRATKCAAAWLERMALPFFVTLKGREGFACLQGQS